MPWIIILQLLNKKLGKFNLQVAGLVQRGDLAAAPGDSSVHAAVVAGNTAKASCWVRDRPAGAYPRLSEALYHITSH